MLFKKHILINTLFPLQRKKADNEAAVKAEKAKSIVCVKLQNVLMQLRKCCNHPYLLEYPINPETQEYLIDENIVKVSGKMKLLDRMLPELKRRGHKVSQPCFFCHTLHFFLLFSILFLS